MDSLTALVAVNVAIWLGIGGYITFLVANQKNLNKKLERLESIK